MDLKDRSDRDYSVKDLLRALDDAVIIAEYLQCKAKEQGHGPLYEYLENLICELNMDGGKVILADYGYSNIK